MGIDLSLIWAVIIIFGIMMYVVMDGFDLGVGILFPFVQDTSDRDVMMNTVAPIWDGNETWLVLGGASLFAAFPLAYSVVLTALYLPLLIMLIALIFRGVAFEFRFKASKQRRLEAVKAMEGQDFFNTVRGQCVTSLYDNEMAFAVFGYEGSAWEKGGYLLRGFQDLKWLPAPSAQASPAPYLG